ncbi:hypothetical protein DSO57_1019871 [Entomophthora muscae]|uniref:Uncharacterized protein n=1 Tax=Entomophthora muscae TaxID=34485 RepID=A0ACC2T3S1_9FUNG|nr:hypothetical protein DSO57_1019871 [Entomophthora muscae]
MACLQYGVVTVDLKDVQGFNFVNVVVTKIFYKQGLRGWVRCGCKASHCYNPHVRTDNFPPLEPQAREQESNPEPGSPQAARPEDCETARLHFSGIEPLQADVEEDDLPRKVD